MNQYRPNEETSDPDTIRRDIEATRSEMGSTIDALQEKLNPDSLKAQVQEAVTEQAEHVKEQVQEAITHQVETVKEHVQDAITHQVDAVKSQVREATVGRVETIVSNVSDTARSLAGDVSDTARSLVGSGSDTHAMRGMSSNTGGGANSLLDTIKANPLPAAMIGLGLGWLYANRGGSAASSSSRQYNDRSPRLHRADMQYRDDDNSPSVGDRMGGTAQTAGDKLGDVAQGAKERVSTITDQAGERVSTITDQAGERVSTITDQAGERVSSLTDQVGERVSTLTNRAQSGARQAQRSLQQTLNENPLMVGAIAMTLGLAAGMALPGTEAENRLLGESRDNLVEQAQAKAQETVQKVQQVAQEVQPAIVDAAKESAQKQGLVGQPNE